MSELDGYDNRNKCVLRVRLNNSTDVAALTLTGSAFDAAGPATAKERSPNLVRVRGTVDNVTFMYAKHSNHSRSVSLGSLKSRRATGYHRLRGSGSTVVTTTSKVNGKTEILTPRRSETPENIEAKLGVNDYDMDPYNLADFWGNRSNGVCSPYC